MKLSLFLFALLIISALSLVTARHDTRKLVSELEIEKNKALKIRQEYARLVIEKSTLAAPARIERLAIKKLGMKYPKSEDTVLLPPPPPPARADQ
ncbi:MAG: cell division protein FtsL [Proteobacteria bacterium]|nr:cell division protein FtsL [Pseudomonadota bacterium]MDA1331102.1 cell division protein FtsL [Pseudomonadota bacterium]